MSFIRFIKSWLKLVRFEHALISAFGVVVGLMISAKAGGDYSVQEFVLALLVPVSINVGAFALNDYLDIEADKHKKHDKRPLVSGEISKEVAIGTSVVGLIAGPVLGFMINPLAGMIATVFSALSFAYNWKLKDIAILGNLFIAISMAIAFVFGAAVAGFSFEQMPIVILILSVGATFAGFGREIVKTVQDMEGDKKARDSKSLPHIIGQRNSFYLAAICFALYSLAIPILIFNADILTLNILSIGLLFISFAAYLTMIHLLLQKEVEMERIRKSSLYALGIAMIALMIASV